MRQTTLDGSPNRYQVYRAQKILNTSKYADSWFWNRYSVHPYVGCDHACEYCYARADKYLHTDRSEDFSQIIKVKRNAAQLLRNELSRVPRDVIVTGDYQPTEEVFGLSRKMLEVVRDLSFPVHVIEKSDLVIKDRDVLAEIHERAWACVSFSFSTLDDISSVFEPGAPPPQKRLRAMKQLAETGVVTGANLIPVLPYITDSVESLEKVIKAVKTHKGTFVLVGGLTLDDNVRVRYFNLLKKEFPSLLKKYEELYESDERFRLYNEKICKKVQELCEEYGVKDRIPRHCLNFNQKVAEHLFDMVYRIERVDPRKAWVYRKAAWVVDELDKDIRLINDLTAIPGIGIKNALIIRGIMRNLNE
jgi:DNA repair photolyase